MNAVLRQRLVAWLLTISFAAHCVRAQTSTTSFVWGFTTLKTTSIQECSRIQIFVGPNTAPQPPYTLIAYEANGIPTVQTLGSDISNLWWNVDHASGSQLVLSMTDGQGNSGGVAAELFSVTPGTSTSCHPQNPSSPISVSTNTTKTLNSCDVLPLTISGGQKPYKITIAALDSTSVTNVSMGVYDQYNWVNRASPNTKLIATVSDVTGTYAAGTALLSTAGSSDLSCDGRQSTLLDSSGKISASQSGTAEVPVATQSATNKSDSNSNGSSKTSIGTIIGGAVAGVVLIGALLVGLLFFLRKKKKARVTGPRQYLDSDPSQGYGLGKVGGVGYPADPVAEEITPFVTAGGQTTPYRDYDHIQHNQRQFSQSQYSQSQYSQSQYSHSQYNQSSSSSGADTLVGTSSYPDQYGRLPPTPQLPPGAAVSPPMSPGPGPLSPSMSSSTFDPYNNTFSNVPRGTSSAPSAYSTSTAQPSAMGISAGPGSVSGSAAAPIAGGSGSTGLLAIANPSGDETRDADVKGGAGPSQAPQPVFQHEDVADVEELPPAYKERLS